MNYAVKELHWPYHYLHGFLINYMPHLAQMIDCGKIGEKINKNKKERPTRMEINAIKEAI